MTPSQVGVLITLMDVLSLVPSSSPTCTCNANSKGYDTPLTVLMHLQSCAHTHVHAHNLKYMISFKNDYLIITSK